MARQAMYGREVWEEICATRRRNRAILILRLAAEGKTDAEIGEELFLALDTVKGHWVEIREMLGARNRTHSVAVALREGWIE